jgi:hypothetical protein
MKNLILGYFLYKYSRSLISTLVQFSLGIVLFCLYVFYKLFQIISLGIHESPIETLLIFSLIAALFYGIHRFQLLCSMKTNKRIKKRLENKFNSKHLIPN